MSIRMGVGGIAASSCGLVAAVCVMFAAVNGCASPSKATALTVRPIPVPANVFSIFGEVRAFATEPSETGKLYDQSLDGFARGPVQVSVRDLLKRFGEFETVRVFALDPDGKTLGVTEPKVSPDSAVSWDAAAGQRYLLYPDLGPHLRATYTLMCKLGQLGLPKELIPKLCQQILCIGQTFRASELPKLVPELAAYVEGAELGNESIGGDWPHPEPEPGGHWGNPCDECIPEPGEWVPDPDCHVVIVGPQPVAHCGDGDRFVYVKRSVTGNDRAIHAMNGDGSGDTTLSASAVTDFAPDVHLHSHEIVFVREVSGATKLFTMNDNGTNVTEVPDSDGAMAPVWGRGGPRFILFSAPLDASRSAIFRLGPGTGPRVQVTFPGTGESDTSPACFDAKSVVFVRDTPGTPPPPQLFMQDMFQNANLRQLTNFSDAAVRTPVCGHLQDDRFVGFVMDFSVFAPTQIRIGRIDNVTQQLVTVSTITPGSPVQQRLGGIDFSANDQCLFFAAFVDDVTPPLAELDRKFELFSVALDGSDLHRITHDQQVQVGPSTITD